MLDSVFEPTEYTADSPLRSCASKAYEPALFRDGDVTLEPLHPQHANAWLTQTRDEQIAELTRLQVFNTIGELVSWLDARWVATLEPIDTDRAQLRSFALTHQHHGFLGSVAVHTIRRAGFFSFWVGADYQGRGFGRSALRILKRIAPSCLEIDELFTAVYEHNARSLRVLERSGWQRLSLRATTDEGPTLVYRSHTGAWTEAAEDEFALRLRVTALLEALGSDLEVEANHPG